MAFDIMNRYPFFLRGTEIANVDQSLVGADICGKFCATGPRFEAHTYFLRYRFNEVNFIFLAS